MDWGRLAVSRLPVELVESTKLPTPPTIDNVDKTWLYTRGGRMIYVTIVGIDWVRVMVVDGAVRDQITVHVDHVKHNRCIGRGEFEVGRTVDFPDTRTCQIKYPPQVHVVESTHDTLSEQDTGTVGSGDSTTTIQRETGRSPTTLRFLVDAIGRHPSTSTPVKVVLEFEWDHCQLRLVSHHFYALKNTASYILTDDGYYLVRQSPRTREITIRLPNGNVYKPTINPGYIYGCGSITQTGFIIDNPDIGRRRGVIAVYRGHVYQRRLDVHQYTTVTLDRHYALYTTDDDVIKVTDIITGHVIFTTTQLPETRVFAYDDRYQALVVSWADSIGIYQHGVRSMYHFPDDMSRTDVLNVQVYQWLPEHHVFIMQLRETTRKVIMLRVSPIDESTT